MKKLYYGGMGPKVASSLGRGIGISCGCNFLAAVMAQDRLPKDSVVVTAFCDDNKKYRSTDLFNHEPVRCPFLSLDIEVVEYRVIGLLGAAQVETASSFKRLLRCF